MDHQSPLQEWARSIGTYLHSSRSGPRHVQGAVANALIKQQDGVLFIYWRRKTALFLLSFSFFIGLILSLYMLLTISSHNNMFNTVELFIWPGLALLILAAIVYNIVLYEELLCALDEEGVTFAGSPEFVLPWKEIEFVVPVYRSPAFITYRELGQERKQRMWDERSALLINTVDPRAVLNDYFAVLAAQKSIRKRRRMQSLIMPVAYESDFEFPTMFDYVDNLRWSWLSSRDRLMVTEQDATFVIFEKPLRHGFCTLPIEEMLALMAKRGVRVRSWDVEL